MANFFEGEDWIYNKLELDRFGLKIFSFLSIVGFGSALIFKDDSGIACVLYAPVFLLGNIINFLIWKNRFKISYALYYILKTQNLLYLSFIVGLMPLIAGSYKYYQNLGIGLFSLSIILFFTVFFLGLKRMDLIEESQLLKTKKLDYKEGTIDIVKHAHTDHEWGEVMWIPKFLKKGPSKSLGLAIMGIAGFIGLKNNLKTDIEFAGGFLKVGSFLFALLMMCYAYMLSIGVWLLRKEKQIGKKFRIKGIKYES